MGHKGFKNQAKSGQKAVPARLKRVKTKAKATSRPATGTRRRGA